MRCERAGYGTGSGELRQAAVAAGNRVPGSPQVNGEGCGRVRLPPPLSGQNPKPGVSGKKFYSRRALSARRFSYE